MEKVEWGDVQGLVLSGYPRLKYSAYVVWRFLPGQSASAKVWLRDLTDRLMRSGSVDKEDADAAHISSPSAPINLRAAKTRSALDAPAINLALTARGLDRLGISSQERAQFSIEFLEGMAPRQTASQPYPRRCNLLGDTGENSPEFWNWGGWGPNGDVDGVLLLYAATNDALNALVAAETKAMAGAAELCVAEPPLAPDALDFRGRVYCDGKEHFGFRDGISQPIIDGTTAADALKREKVKEARISVVKPGEFVLGYLNERGARASCYVGSDPSALGLKTEREQARQLGRNGTYLVFRQLEQNVQAFDAFVSQTAKRVFGEASSKTREWVASRLMGRLPSGEPLVAASADCDRGSAPRNDFLYHFEDRFGLACPIGAHIRRANPRDMIGPDPDTALRLSKMHRIIRRGRTYGERQLPGAESEANDSGQKPRGMFFICLNADIAGQFELIQHSWLNNTHFSGLYAGTDPLSHFRDPRSVIAIQRRPTNLHIDGLKPFVTVRGGAYFFLPGIKALRALAR